MNIVGNKSLVIGIAIVFVIAIIIIIAAYLNFNITPNTYEKFIQGFWTAPPDYCEDVGVASMQIFIGEMAEGMRKAHLLINNDITNQQLEICYSPTMSGYIAGPLSNKYSISPIVNFEDEETFPKEGTIWEFDIYRGMLKIHDEKTLYGVFHKDSEISSLFMVDEEESDE